MTMGHLHSRFWKAFLLTAILAAAAASFFVFLVSIHHGRGLPVTLVGTAGTLVMMAVFSVPWYRACGRSLKATLRGLLPLLIPLTLHCLVLGMLAVQFCLPRR